MIILETLGFTLLAVLAGIIIFCAFAFRRIRVLESDLGSLQRAFISLRDRVDSRPVAKRAAEPVAVNSNAKIKDELVKQPSIAEQEPELRSEEPAPVKTPSTMTLESALGGRWAVWVGGIALALGGVLLVRYSIESGLLSPRIRVSLGFLLGLFMLLAGEYLRRGGYQRSLPGFSAADLPGILAASGAFVLFGSIFSAHALYELINAPLAFILLGTVGATVIILSLLHGQIFGGLGVLGSLATPILVASDAPNPWALFGFLAFVLLITAIIARAGRWWPLVATAIGGTGLWALAYISSSTEISAAAVTFIGLAPAVILVFVWLDGGEDDWDPRFFIPWLTVAVFGGLEMLALAMSDHEYKPIAIAVLGTALIGAAVWRICAIPALFASGLATILWQIYAYFGDYQVVLTVNGVVVEGAPQTDATQMAQVSFLLAAVFLAVGAWKARSMASIYIFRAASWALFAVCVPLIVTFFFWIGFGKIDRDLTYFATFLSLALVFLVAGEGVALRERPPHAGQHAVSLFLSGSLAALVMAIHAGLGPGMTAIFCGMAIALPVFALRYRNYDILPLLSVAVSVIVLGRFIYDPSIVGELEIGNTVIFNWLLPGYGVPAIAAAWSAWRLRKLKDGRPRIVMEAFAALFALLAVAMLVRHAMNAGKIYAGAPGLAEQSIYSIIAIGGGAILIALDNRAPSPIFRIGSIALGALSMLSIAFVHFVALNPLITNESTGKITFFNLLLLAYLLPAIAIGTLALYARWKRPKIFVACLGLVSAMLAFAYVSFSIRRWFWGEYIGSWKGLVELETYTYSAAWLGVGVIVLITGIALGSAVLRLASAALVVISVGKVFLFDMAQLDGVLRAVSFLGLGSVLIGIGFFYQKTMRSEASG